MRGISGLRRRLPSETRLYGGERGIRTLDTLPYTHFPGVRLQPLGHLSNKIAVFPLKTCAEIRLSSVPHLSLPAVAFDFLSFATLVLPFPSSCLDICSRHDSPDPIHGVVPRHLCIRHIVQACAFNRSATSPVFYPRLTEITCYEAREGKPLLC